MDTSTQKCYNMQVNITKYNLLFTMLEKKSISDMVLSPLFKNCFFFKKILKYLMFYTKKIQPKTLN